MEDIAMRDWCAWLPSASLSRMNIERSVFLAILSLASLPACGASHRADDAPPTSDAGTTPAVEDDASVPTGPREPPPWLRLSRTSSVSDVIEHEGVVYVATSTGLAVQAPSEAWSTLTPETGELPGLSVTALAGGGDGSLWVGTSNGLAVLRHDRWTQIDDAIARDPSSGDVHVRYAGGPLTADSRGRLWVATQGGDLARFDGSWTVIERDSIGLPAGRVRALGPGTDGSVWAALVPEVIHSFVEDPEEVGGGLLRVDDGGIVTALSSEDGSLPSSWVLDLAVRRDGSVAALLPEQVVVVDEEGVRAIALPAGADVGGGASIVAGPSGELAVSTGAQLWVHTAAGFVARDLPPGAGDVQVHGITDGGRMWITAPELMVSEAGGGWTALDPSFADIPTNRLRDVAVTSDDRVWLATEDRGLVAFDGERFSSHAEDSPVGSASVQAVAADARDDLWLIAGDERLVRLSEGDFQSWTIPLEREALLRFELTLNVDCEGDVWIGAVGGSHGGLLHFDGASWRFFGHEDLPTNHSVVSIDCSATDGLFVGTMYGNVTLLDDGRFHDITSGRTGAPFDYIHVVRSDARRGGVWVGHGSIGEGGLTHFDGSEWSPLDLSELGGPATVATALGEDTDGSMLFVAGNAVARIQPDGRSFERLQPVVHQTSVAALEADSRGNLYLATLDGGLVVYRAGGVVGLDRYLP